VDIRFIVQSGEISYLVTNKKNRNDQEPGLTITGNLTDEGLIDKNVRFK